MNRDGLNILIRSERNFKHLDLSFNELITPLCISTLMHHKNLNKLESLILRGVCTVTRSDEVSFFANYPANPNLKMLDISYNRFTTPQQLFFNTNIFPHLSSLKRLLISFNWNEPQVDDSLQDLTDNMPELEVLNKPLEE